METLLEGDWFENAISKLSKQGVDVAIPRFGFTCEPPNTASILASLGIKKIFSPSYEFAGISDEELQVGCVKHRAWLEVTEEGTEAAAATVVTIVHVTCVGVPSGRPQFIADHPFLFMIRHNATGMPLFIGRVSNPLSQ